MPHYRVAAAKNNKNKRIEIGNSWSVECSVCLKLLYKNENVGIIFYFSNKYLYTFYTFCFFNNRQLYENIYFHQHSSIFLPIIYLSSHFNYNANAGGIKLYILFAKCPITL